MYGVASGCGCKEVYRFPHTTYPYSCIRSFLQQHSYFKNNKKYNLSRFEFFLRVQFFPEIPPKALEKMCVVYIFVPSSMMTPHSCRQLNFHCAKISYYTAIESFEAGEK